MTWQDSGKMTIYVTRFGPIRLHSCLFSFCGRRWHLQHWGKIHAHEAWCRWGFSVMQCWDSFAKRLSHTGKMESQRDGGFGSLPELLATDLLVLELRERSQTVHLTEASCFVRSGRLFYFKQNQCWFLFWHGNIRLNTSWADTALLHHTFKGAIQHFRKYTFSVSCWELDEISIYLCQGCTINIGLMLLLNSDWLLGVH